MTTYGDVPGTLQTTTDMAQVARALGADEVWVNEDTDTHDLRLSETGVIGYSTYVDGVGVVTERFYPLCGNAVQTEVFNGHQELRVRPDTYTKRAVTKQYGP